MISSTSSFKPLLAKTAVWLALFIAANLVAREPVSRLVETPVRLQKQIIAASRAPIVILGDSHAIPLGDADGKLLNLARGGDSLAEMRAKLDYLLQQGYPIKTVVLSLPWHSLSAGRSVRNNRQQGELFTTSESYAKIYGDASWKYWLRTQLFQRMPLLNPVNGRLARRYLAHWLFPDPPNRPWASLSPAQRQTDSYNRWQQNYGQAFDPRQLAQLDGLIDDCKEAGVPLQLIRPPVTPNYQQLVEDSDEYHQGQEALKARGLSVKEWPTPAALEEFENQDHLKRFGATARQIRQDLLQALP